MLLAEWMLQLIELLLCAIAVTMYRECILELTFVDFRNRG